MSGRADGLQKGLTISFIGIPCILVCYTNIVYHLRMLCHKSYVLTTRKEWAHKSRSLKILSLGTGTFSEQRRVFFTNMGANIVEKLRKRRKYLIKLQH